ncbi:MAG: SH3 domain-containing protein [Saprospiraceae bacterium]|nr:SH3 domain-containing protein [Saprospiraceae bacterium]
MRPILLGLIVLFAVLSSCRQGDGQQETTQGADTFVPLSPDSLSRLYTSYLAKAKQMAMPTQQIIEEGKLYPVDQAPLDTGFYVFRELLRQTVAHKDVIGLMKVVDPQIKCGFGGDDGAAAFVRQWQIDTPAKTPNSALWAVLEDILAGGGTFDASKNVFTAPYVFATFPDQYDGTSFGALTGSGVRLRAEPNLTSEIVKTISYDIVEILETSEAPDTLAGRAYPWYKVKMADEKTGYVFGQFLGLPIGYRVAFERRGPQQWKMVMLVAGD